MIKRPEQIWQPANRYFIAMTILFVFLLNLMFSGQVVAPDFVALIVFFWNIYQPRKVGMTVAFLMGLVADVHSGSFLGEHALAYTLLSYIAFMFHRRMFILPMVAQVLYVMPVFILVSFIPFLIQIVAGHAFLSLTFLLKGLIEALLWPVMTYLLKRFQYRRRNQPVRKKAKK